MPRRTLLLTLLLVSLTTWLAWPPAPDVAHAQGSGEVGYDDGYGFAGYVEHPVHVTSVDRTRPRAPTRWCVHWPLTLAAVVGDIASLTPDEVRELSRTYRGPLVDGGWYQLICYRTGETAPYVVRIIELRRSDPTDGEITTIETVREHARDLVTAPAPSIATSPPPDRLVVGFETWLAIPDPIDAPVASAQAGHLWAIAVPVPAAVTYELGDGTTLRCEGPPVTGPPGVRADERPDCARHTYLDSRSDDGIGWYTVRVTVTYDVWVTTSEDPTPQLVDSIEGPTTELPVTVREIQAVIR
ncbi:MAG TPA: hypothetical protein VF183_14210 [Acidimicrobiales bacterium]